MPHPLHGEPIPPSVRVPGSAALIHALSLLRDTHIPITLLCLAPSRPLAEAEPALETLGFTGRLADGSLVLLLIGGALDLPGLLRHPALSATRPLAILQVSAADIGAPEDLLLQLAATARHNSGTPPPRLAA